MNRSWIALCCFAALAAAARGGAAPPRVELPWRDLGWEERAAAAHLLDRLAYGARPGEVDAVVARGLDVWVEEQLAAARAEPELERRLAALPALAMTSEEIQRTYPPGFALRRMAEEAGVVSQEELERALDGSQGRAALEIRARIRDWMAREGYRPERELLAQGHAAKLVSAIYSENQLREVLADFWFNHFNVSLTDPPVRQYLLGYERDAIRPHSTGRFRDLLGATAKHPAMLLYLDNFQSVAAPGQPTTLAREVDRARERGASGAMRSGALGRGAARAAPRSAEVQRRLEERRRQRPDRPQGLNENYARELLELHTLGVDGGYTQADVVEVARAFTGWTLLPAGRLGEVGRQGLERAGRAGGLGFERQGDFLFRGDAHDAGEKRVLGARLPAGRGLEDGEQVLDLLAAHPATARHLAAKLAARFVADEPPASLVDRLAATFETSRGDLEQVLRALLESPEFWAPEARAAKIKSPFEVAVSALRALGAEVDNPIPTLEWIARMGQPLYAYAAPTGYPDRAEAWVNTGSLLTRMNFGLELAAGRIGGVRFAAATVAGRGEPESARAALERIAGALLPGRALAPTLEQLEPLLGEPEMARRVAERNPAGAADPVGAIDLLGDEPMARSSRPSGSRRGRAVAEDPALADLFPPPVAMAGAGEPPSALAGIVGLVLGSPEFQRR